MRVRMQVGVSGGRGDGTWWPEPGGELTVSDEEGRDLCAAGLAIPVTDPDADVEKRATLPKRAPGKK